MASHWNRIRAPIKVLAQSVHNEAENIYSLTQDYDPDESIAFTFIHVRLEGERAAEEARSLFNLRIAMLPDNVEMVAPTVLDISEFENRCHRMLDFASSMESGLETLKTSAKAEIQEDKDLYEIRKRSGTFKSEVESMLSIIGSVDSGPKRQGRWVIPGNDKAWEKL